jgi:23S rRNA pseudouridine1911/1915/1917 synthase
MDRVELHVRNDERKKRLEDFLFDRFGGLSKMYLREIVRDGKCEVNGRLENVGYRVRSNDFLEIELDLSRENAMRPQEMTLDIVFEDDQLIVVNKPAEMLVHPTHRDKNGTLLNGLAYYLNRQHLPQRRVDAATEPGAIAIADPTAIRPGLVHRLDKQTSGLLVISKTDRAHRVLANYFKKKLVDKRYLALVEGIVDKDGTIEAPIGRFAEHKHWGIKHDGKHSETRYWVRERYADATLLELEPVTGRTNQLRIHCESIGHPIVGDVKRGGREFERLCLHAYRLSFNHPLTGEQLIFERHIELKT